LSTPTDQIYDLKGPAALPAQAPPALSPPLAQPPDPPAAPVAITKLPRALPPSALRRLHIFTNYLTWIIVAIFLVGGADWAFRAGMDQRDQIWQYTRIIRFKDDILRGFMFGNSAMRFAESAAGLQPKADALAGLPQSDQPVSATFRRLTPLELVHGIAGYVDNIVAGGGEFNLDYTPLRLAVMTLWVRHEQRLHPDLDNYPEQRVEDSTLRQDEDITEPLLDFNAYCDIAAAVGMFALVWLWVHRSFKPARPFVLERWWRKWRGLPKIPAAVVLSNPRWAWTVPHGLFAFIAATSAFWYAYVTLVHMPPRPPPVVSVVQVQPGDGAASVVAGINSQNQDTTWRVDFGPTPAYGHTTGPQSADTSLTDQQLAAKLQPIENGQTVHFRIVATSPAGSIASNDFSFVNNPGASPIDVYSDPVGGIDWPTCSVWLRLLVLFIAMVVAAQLLPPNHRGWACGAVAAMLVWLDPVNLMDSHAWPQWDVWILPIFIFAALFASLNWWLAAGFLLGVGIMFKGQLLLAGPILILWPFFEGRYGALWRVITGSLLGAELVTWPWIINSSASMQWIVLAMTAAVIILALSRARKIFVRTARQWIIDPLIGPSEATILGPKSSPTSAILQAAGLIFALTLAAVLILQPIARHRADLPPGTLTVFLLLVLIPPFFLRASKLRFWIAGIFAFTVCIAAGAFDGSFSWATLGFAYGSVRHDQMQMGNHVFTNLTTILSQSYSWDIHDPMTTLHLAFKTPGPWRLGSLAIPSVDYSWSTDLDVKTAMAVLYGFCLLLASAAAALHHRRNDRRFLIALVVPWIVFPVVMCQMGGRYTIWASCLSAAMVGVSLELSLLHVLLAVVAFAEIARQLVNYESSRWPQLWDLTGPWFPGVGWLMVFIAAIFVVASLVPSRKCLNE
jgi:hypothetical protein